MPGWRCNFFAALIDTPRESNVWVYFEVVNPDEQVHLLIGKGIYFEELPNDKQWLWREARLKDIDNNQIILYYAGCKRKNPPWRVNLNIVKGIL